MKRYCKMGNKGRCIIRTDGIQENDEFCYIGPKGRCRKKEGVREIGLDIAARISDDLAVGAADVGPLLGGPMRARRPRKKIILIIKALDDFNSVFRDRK